MAEQFERAIEGQRRVAAAAIDAGAPTTRAFEAAGMPAPGYARAGLSEHERSAIWAWAQAVRAVRQIADIARANPEAAELTGPALRAALSALGTAETRYRIDVGAEPPSLRGDHLREATGVVTAPTTGAGRRVVAVEPR